MPASRLAPDDIAITAKQNLLTVEGRKGSLCAVPEYPMHGRDASCTIAVR
jgi:hypothetical protein